MEFLDFDLPGTKLAKSETDNKLMDLSTRIETWKGYLAKHEAEAKKSKDPEEKKLHEDMAAQARKSVKLLESKVKGQGKPKSASLDDEEDDAIIIQNYSVETQLEQVTHYIVVWERIQHDLNYIKNLGRYEATTKDQTMIAKEALSRLRELQTFLKKVLDRLESPMYEIGG